MLDVRKFLAIPYKDKGKDFDGCSCWGFPMLFYRVVLNKILPDINEDNKIYFVENYFKYFKKIEKPKLYDIVAFKNHQGIVDHSGIVLDYGKFIHCCKDGVLVDFYNRERWQRRLNGFYRLKENE